MSLKKRIIEYRGVKYDLDKIREASKNLPIRYLSVATAGWRVPDPSDTQRVTPDHTKDDPALVAFYADPSDMHKYTVLDNEHAVQAAKLLGKEHYPARVVSYSIMLDAIIVEESTGV